MTVDAHSTEKLTIGQPGMYELTFETSSTHGRIFLKQGSRIQMLNQNSLVLEGQYAYILKVTDATAEVVIQNIGDEVIDNVIIKEAN